MNSVTIGYKRNVIKSWKSVQPISFPNWDLIEDTVKILNERRMKGGITEFYWVKGHSGNAGNEAADKLAGNGARYALPTPDRV
jgi:ribonuclease HI